MDTFTFRVPDSLAGRLSSVQMRAWLADFLRQPHILPADPGSGEERVSLTLPSEAVRHAATFLRCSQSVALRRIATERLAISFSAAAVHQEAIADSHRFLPGMAAFCFQRELKNGIGNMTNRTQEFAENNRFPISAV
ncbi:MAG: hypothetical protein DME89_09710 [Verrucomicrobia bacterium]|nr:MAG: hypothetical protein DME89_09710 [Verrucomicrobiota bacterium]